ncbi:DEKNAAC104724 [Brettanomyces naardenensis]|uniref:GPI mannosyltransferase 2 n=1 Tax=Brettanomyces naardenensis TaxID=13370 RepID=A0A448YRM1_BRENA|nr:DEKNAAC104724 [Brettanomyces naardenensis]
MFHYFFRASTQNIYDTLALSMLVNLCCHLVSCILIFMLTVKVFEGTKNISSNRLHVIATACSLLCIIQPSGIFSTVVCAESISQMLCYLGLYSRVAALKMSLRTSKSVFLYLLSGLLFATAFGFRSNCLLYGILYLYDLYGGLRKAHFSKMFWAILSGLIILSALILSLYVPYAEYCPLRGEWCASSTKSLVSFAQKYYWNVGFLNYFTLGNIPLFIIAFPQLLVILLSLIYFHSFEAIRGEWLVTVVYLFLQIFIMHVQIVNRVSTFLPIHFWFLAFIHSGDNKSVVFLYSQKFARYVILFWTVWIFVQAGLFGSFLPPA